MKKSWIIVFAITVLSCRQHEREINFSVNNKLNIDRKETVAIPRSRLLVLSSDSTAAYQVVDATGQVVPSQLVDNNADGETDELIFQASLKANESQRFKIKAANNDAMPLPEERTYARFVPERIDDFAWENDRVGFRTYGPEAQRLVDENEKGGTLSSGIDCWLKRVSYPVIDKWYKKYVDGGTYHKDEGEGYDPYHVGISRGCGGIGVWKNDSLYVSKNFISYKVIANGPIRTIFELTYAPWKVDSVTVNETKRISIDLGSQLSKFDVQLQSSSPLPNGTIGITLHDKKGEVKIDSIDGFYRYWEPLDDSEIGTAVATDPETVQQAIDYRTDKKELSHIYIIKKTGQHFSYYAGFAWKKAGIIESAEAWDSYLKNFAMRLSSPVEVVFGQ